MNFDKEIKTNAEREREVALKLVPSQQEEINLREKFHSFWNNKLYGDGDTEPIFPSYSEIQDFWLNEITSLTEAHKVEMERIKALFPKLNPNSDSFGTTEMERILKEIDQPNK